MPKILLFAACERVLTDMQSNSLSLISLLENINVPAPEGVEVPSDANAPMRWDILAQWQVTPDDMGKRFEQRTYIALPDGKEVVEAIVPFEMNQPRQNNVVNVTGFPIGQSGICSVVVSLREAGKENGWQQISAYTVNVVHQKQAVILSLPNMDKV